MRGCGKSRLTLALSKSYPRIIVFDKMKEWKNRGTIVNSLDEFKTIWRKHFHADRFTIVVHFPFGSSIEETQDIASQIAEIVYRTGIQSGLETCLIFEEAQFYLPNNSLTPVFFELLTTGRHARINIIANTQRPASIHKMLISQSSEVYIGQLFEMRDIAYLYQSVGSVAENIPDLQKFEFIKYEIGNPEQVIVTL